MRGGGGGSSASARPLARAGEIDTPDPIPEDDAAFHQYFQRLLERAEQVEISLHAEAQCDNELAAAGEALERNLEIIATKHAEAEKNLEINMAKDTENLETAKQKHEEVKEEFNEFCNWHLVEPRSLFWRILDKVSFYTTVILSFIFVVPITAIYSKALRFFRSRRRRNRSTPYERPAWTYGHGEVEPDFSPSDFFGEGGLARLAMNPLRLSSTSLGGENQVAQLGSANEPDLFSDPPDVNGRIGAAHKFISRPSGSNDSMKAIEREDAANIVISNTKLGNGTRRRRRNGKDNPSSLIVDDERRCMLGTDSGSQVTEEGNDSRVSEPETSLQLDINNVDDAEEERRRREQAGWVMEQNQNWEALENQNSKDFWESFGDIGRKTSPG